MSRLMTPCWQVDGISFWLIDLRRSATVWTYSTAELFLHNIISVIGFTDVSHQEMSICSFSNERCPTQQKGLWVYWSAASGQADRGLQPPWAFHPSGLVMKFKAPKGGLHCVLWLRLSNTWCGNLWGLKGQCWSLIQESMWIWWRRSRAAVILSQVYQVVSQQDSLLLKHFCRLTLNSLPALYYSTQQSQQSGHKIQLQ